MHDSSTVSQNNEGIRNPKGGLWRNHLATEAQQRLGFPSRSKHPTQAELLAEMLREARRQDRALQLPQIMAAGIAQHGARFHELRLRGFIVENQTLRDGSGRTQSRYFLRFDPEAEGQQ